MAKIKKKAETANTEIVLSEKYKEELMKQVNFDADMISLTDLWKATGSPVNKKPLRWLRLESSKQLIETLAIMLQSAEGALWKTRRGGSNPGTYAHKSIALAYAKYLDAKLHVAVNEVFFQRIEEEKNPDLIVDRFHDTYKRKGKSDKWIAARLTGRATRNYFTATLSQHGVSGPEGYRNCSNAIYNPLYGGTTAVIRMKKELSPKENIRDNLPLNELVAIMFAESQASETIKKENLHGNAQCEMACTRASKIVAKAITENSKKMS